MQADCPLSPVCRIIGPPCRFPRPTVRLARRAVAPRRRSEARMRRRRDQFDPGRRGRAAVGWGLLAFLVAAAAQAAAFDSRPDLYDVEYGARLDLVRARLAEAPGRPLLVAVGSSRLVMAFAPEQLPPVPTADGPDALPFNFGHVGAGPIQNLMDVSRMLADGVRPRWLFLEMMPAFVAHE